MSLQSEWRKITPHFGYREFFQLRKAGYISKADVCKAFYLASLVLEPLRKAMNGNPLLITSGKRSPADNIRVDGSTKSDHLFRNECAAVDISFYDKMQNRAALKWLRENRLPAIGQLIAYLDEMGTVRWIHVSLPSRKHQGELLFTTVKKPRVYAIDERGIK